MAHFYTAAVFSNASGNTAKAVHCVPLQCDTAPVRHPLTLKTIRKKRGLTQHEVAAMIGVEQPTYQRWETGTRTLDADDIQKLADAFGVSPGELFGSSQVIAIGPHLFVVGAVAAGVWREAIQWHEEEWLAFNGRPDVTVPMDKRFGLRVEGDSMNEIYPHGTIVECVRVDAAGPLVSGKRVIVHRRREDGEYEATVKEYVVDADGAEWLVPRSLNPAFQQAIRLDAAEPGIEEIQIIAVVVASYRPE